MTYHGKGLKAGEGGEKVLREWMGWTQGKEWEVDAKKGAAQVTGRSKL